MKVVYYNRLLNEPWGCGVHGRALVEAWRRAGHEVLCIPFDLAPPGSLVESRMRRAPWLKGALRPLALDLRGRLRAISAAPRVIDAVGRFAPDVICARRAAYDYVLDALVARVSVPVVAEVNAVLHWEMREMEGESVLPAEVSRERRFLSSAHACVAVSERIAAQVRACDVSPDAVHVVANGTDVDTFRPDVERDPESAEWASRFSGVVAYCGTFAANHDMDLLAEAVRLLWGRHDVAFLFIGPTTDEVRPLLGEQADSGRVRCTGRVSHGRVPGLLACADVCWAALSNDRGSALKLLEYMAMALPVAFADEEQGRQTLLESGCGKAVARQDAAAMADAVGWLVDNREEAGRMGARGRAWVEAHGRWSVTADKMLNVVGERTYDA